MKLMLKTILSGRRTILYIFLYMLTAIGAGFLLIYANELLAIVLNNYLMVQYFYGFATRLLLTAGAFTLIFIINTFGAYLFEDLQWSAIMRLAHHHIARLLHAKQEFFTNRPAAEVYTNLWTASQASGEFFSNILSMISRTVIFVFYGVVVFRFDTWAGVFTVAALPIYFLFTARLGDKVAELEGEYIEYDAELATVTQEAFENVANVKAKGAYNFFTGRSIQVLRKIKNNCVKIFVFEHYTTNITGLFRIIAPILIIFGAIQVSSTFDASAGNIMVLFINIPLFLGGFAGIHSGYIGYKVTKPFLSKLQEFDNTPLESDSGIDITYFESLQTKGVKVTLEGGRIITVPDFEVKAGEKVMFFGESGVGKSTVFNIIMGFNHEYEGNIYVNDENLREISFASLRKIFGITFQHNNALTLDLRGNILLGADKSDIELEQLIKLTALESQHEYKGETVLNNKVLSGGEKSRLGLSQMLAIDPKIILIDEAFSNMDEQLESKIIKDLFNVYHNHAVICISHRNSSKPFFDRVVDFNEML